MSSWSNARSYAKKLPGKPRQPAQNSKLKALLRGDRKLL
jgi:hypothetical protein